MVWNAVFLFAVFTVGHAAVPLFHPAENHGSIQTNIIDDPSGLAASHIHPGIFYTHNDHHGLNRVFALDPKTGSLKAILTITEAVNHDWESIAVAPCGGGAGGSCIYIGDIGGSDGSLHNVVYKTREPANLRDQSLPILQKAQFTWDQPESECLMVDPSGSVYVVSREQDGGVLGRIPETGWEASSVPITEVQPLNINSGHHDPLACDISADGKEMLIKGRKAIYYYAIYNGDVLGAVKAHPEQVPYHYVSHGQGIAWTLSADGYYTLAQQDHSTFYFYGRKESQIPTATHSHITTIPAGPANSGTAGTHPVTRTSPAKTPQFSSGEEKSVIATSDLDNVSGLAASRVHSGIYYVHGDNGYNNLIFAIDPNNAGDIKATYTITGVAELAWEDIAVGPCPTGSCIYIIDTGKSGGLPRNIIYMVKEPTEIKDTDLPLQDQIHFIWNEPESQCIMVDPSGSAFIISKTTGGVNLAEIPSSAWIYSSFNLQQTQSLPFNTTHNDTLGCDLSVNGEEMLIQTQNNVYYYSVTGGDVTAAVQVPATSLPYHREEHGEAIAWNPSADGYYTVGKGHALPFYYYERQ